MALAERAGQLHRRRAAPMQLAITALLGAVFLGIKLYEWHLEAAEQLLPLRGLSFAAPEGVGPGFRAFFNLYYTVTGLHAVHLTVGLGIVAAMILQTWRWRRPERLARRMTMAAMYWHFVDVVWVFLYPVLYLV